MPQQLVAGLRMDQRCLSDRDLDLALVGDIAVF